jgi:hypothetical protein
LVKNMAQVHEQRALCVDEARALRIVDALRLAEWYIATAADFIVSGFAECARSGEFSDTALGLAAKRVGQAINYAVEALEMLREVAGQVRRREQATATAQATATVAAADRAGVEARLLPSRRALLEYIRRHPELLEDMLKCKRGVVKRVAEEIGYKWGTICWGVAELRRYGLI